MHVYKIGQITCGKQKILNLKYPHVELTIRFLINYGEIVNISKEYILIMCYHCLAMDIKRENDSPKRKLYNGPFRIPSDCKKIKQVNSRRHQFQLV